MYEKPTYVYVMRLNRAWGGFVKIGLSNWVERRVEQLDEKWENDGETWRVKKVLIKFRCDTRAEAERLEKFCHWVFFFLRWSENRGHEREQFFMPVFTWKLIYAPVKLFRLAPAFIRNPN